MLRSISENYQAGYETKAKCKKGENFKMGRFLKTAQKGFHYIHAILVLEVFSG